MRKCARSLAWFVRRAWLRYETAPFLDNWHIDLVCDHVQACYRRQIKRLIVNFPPRMMKSGIVTVCAPCWWWTQDPGERFVFASYSSDLSRDHSLARRRIITSEWYEQNWSIRSTSNLGLRSRRGESLSLDLVVAGGEVLEAFAAAVSICVLA